MTKIFIFDDTKNLYFQDINRSLRTFGVDSELIDFPDNYTRIINDKNIALVVISTVGREELALDFCLQAKSKKSVILIGQDVDPIYQVLAFELDIVDFIPISTEKVITLSRIQSHYRRASLCFESMVSKSSPDRILIGGLSLNYVSGRAYLHGRGINLSETDFRLLWLLALNVGKVVTRSHLVEQLSGVSYDGYSRSVDVAISRLRRKIGDNARFSQMIKTIRSKGYLLNPNAWDPY